MTAKMKRREFITLLGGAAAAWPLAARAQRPAMPVIGFLSSTSAAPYKPFVDAFFEGLRQKGYIEGKNLTVEYRWADGQYGRLSGFANDLVRLPASDIVAVAPPAREFITLLGGARYRIRKLESPSDNRGISEAIANSFGNPRSSATPSIPGKTIGTSHEEKSCRRPLPCCARDACQRPQRGRLLVRQAPHSCHDVDCQSAGVGTR
jgi:hypothetical protein